MAWYWYPIVFLGVCLAAFLFTGLLSDMIENAEEAEPFFAGFIALR